jgi:hypothetical protein
VSGSGYPSGRVSRGSHMASSYGSPGDRIEDLPGDSPNLPCDRSEPDPSAAVRIGPSAHNLGELTIY